MGLYQTFVQGWNSAAIGEHFNPWRDAWRDAWEAGHNAYRVDCDVDMAWRAYWMRV